MAAPTFVANSSPVAPNLTTFTASPSYPASIQSGDLIIMNVAIDSGGIIGAAPAGWTQAGSVQTGGGISMQVWYKTAIGTETGAVNISVAGASKGVAYMEAYRPVTSGNVLTVTASQASDSDTTSTSFALTGSPVFISAANDLIVAHVLTVAASGTFSGGGSGAAITQATMGTSSPRVSGRTSSNTLWYQLIDRVVNAGATAAPNYSVTMPGANASGSGILLLLRETPPPPTQTSASMSWWGSPPIATVATGSSDYATASATSGTTLSCPLPLTTADNDVLCALVFSKTNTTFTTATAPSGWTKQQSVSSSDTFEVWTRPVASAASEAAAGNPTWTQSASGRWGIIMFRIMNANPSNFIDSIGTPATTTSSPISVPGIITSINNQLVILFSQNRNSGTAQNVYSTPSGMTQLTELVTGGTGGFSSASVFFANVSTAGSATGNYSLSVGGTIVDVEGFVLSFLNA